MGSRYRRRYRYKRQTTTLESKYKLVTVALDEKIHLGFLSPEDALIFMASYGFALFKPLWEITFPNREKGYVYPDFNHYYEQGEMLGVIPVWILGAGGFVTNAANIKQSLSIIKSRREKP